MSLDVVQHRIHQRQTMSIMNEFAAREGFLLLKLSQICIQIKEIIREKVLKTLREEVPHSVAIYMDHIEWEKKPMQIFASIIVEKDSQKGIVIGKNGSRIKEIGTKARMSIEKLLNQHVFLELQVKVDEGWRESPSSLKEYGYKYEK